MNYFVISILVATLVIALIFLVRFYFSRLVDKRIAAFQNDLVEKHCAEVQNMYSQMRGWRHDYHNHIQTIKAHLALTQLSEMEIYLGKLDADLTSVDTVLKTGNVMADAIINSKISLAKAKQINVNAKASVPEKIAISEIDLCVVIGNLLDNAMEACAKLPEENDRFIRLYINVIKEQIYVSISNSASGKVAKTAGRFLTTKKGSHGFGLLRVDHIVEKYKGYINRQSEDGVFSTEVMLPL